MSEDRREFMQRLAALAAVTGAGVLPVPAGLQHPFDPAAVDSDGLSRDVARAI